MGFSSNDGATKAFQAVFCHQYRVPADDYQATAISKTVSVRIFKSIALLITTALRPCLKTTLSISFLTSYAVRSCNSTRENSMRLQIDLGFLFRGDLATCFASGCILKTVIA